jgi:hypothetical protein
MLHPWDWLRTDAATWPSQTARRQDATDRRTFQPERSHSPSRARLRVW